MRSAAIAVWLTIALTTAGLSACGADSEGPAGDGDQNSRSVSTPSVAATTEAATNAQKPQDPDPTDGRLTSSSGEVITDFGDERDRKTAVKTLDRLQDDFRGGRMAAACASINDFLLSQFRPRGTEAQTPCPEKLEAYAAARARRGDSPERLRLLWVRSYPTESGVWVEDASGERLRIQLSNVGGDGPLLDLGPSGRPGLVAAELVGADAYVTR